MLNAPRNHPGLESEACPVKAFRKANVSEFQLLRLHAQCPAVLHLWLFDASTAGMDGEGDGVNQTKSADPIV